MYMHMYVCTHTHTHTNTHTQHPHTHNTNIHTHTHIHAVQSIDVNLHFLHHACSCTQRNVLHSSFSPMYTHMFMSIQDHSCTQMLVAAYVCCVSHKFMYVWSDFFFSCIHAALTMPTYSILRHGTCSSKTAVLRVCDPHAKSRP
jgi:hypothetical protein